MKDSERESGPRSGSICNAKLERHGAPHLCLLDGKHDGPHLCNSCGLVWGWPEMSS